MDLVKQYRLLDDNLDFYYHKIYIFYMHSEKNIFFSHDDETATVLTNLFNFVSHFRELSSQVIYETLHELSDYSHYLFDSIIFIWSLPHYSSYLAKDNYDQKYINLCKEHNDKLVALIDVDFMYEFVRRALTGNKKIVVPLHCLAFFWNYIVDGNVIPQFSNSATSSMISIQRDLDDTTITFNIHYALQMHLGIHPKIQTLGEFMMELLQSPTTINAMLQSTTGHNLQKQLDEIKKTIFACLLAQ